MFFESFKALTIRICVLSIAASLAIGSFAGTEETEAEIAQFKAEMLDRSCVFRSTQEGRKLREELGWDTAKFSFVMMVLSLRGELVCAAGCELIDDRCP